MMHHDHFIEQLSEAATFHRFLTLSTAILDQQVERLIQRVFHKTDFALKSVVDSLFSHQGPLAELSVRLKVLLGLGIISAPLYQDITAFIDFNQRLNLSITALNFTHLSVIQFAEKLHFVDFEMTKKLHSQQSTIESQDSIQFQIQQIRLEKVVRSSLILAITTMLEQLDVESPL